MLEGLNSLSTTCYFNYLFFYMQAEFGFGRVENLGLSALHGLVYVFAAWLGGQFAQRHGYFLAMRLGFAGMGLALASGHLAAQAVTHVLIVMAWTTAMCLTWPAMEAVVVEGASAARLQRALGIYNLVWAGSNAVGFFFGGALFDALGAHSLFTLPPLISAAQFALATWLGRQPFEPPAAASAAALAAAPAEEASAVERQRSPISPRLFLRMAWFANPLAYVAINSLVPVMPDLARRFGISPTQTGVFCSVWFFARTLAFAGLWYWTGWHYRFRWLMSAFAVMIGAFLLILLAPALAVLVGAQVLFGGAIGLIYYSSLYYSMDVGDTKGEHGGFHEAAIGAGICAGPSIGAAALLWAPQRADAGTWATGLVLVAGSAVLAWWRWRGRG